MDHAEAGQLVAELATKLAKQKSIQTKEPLAGMLELAAKLGAHGRVAAALNVLYAAAHHTPPGGAPLMPTKAREQCREVRDKILGPGVDPAGVAEGADADPAPAG